MHGITRTRNLREGTEPSYAYIRRIEVRYSDGRVRSFMAEGGREFFSQDDTKTVQKLLNKTSATAEWADLS